MRHSIFHGIKNTRITKHVHWDKLGFSVDSHFLHSLEAWTFCHLSSSFPLLLHYAIIEQCLLEGCLVETSCFLMGALWPTCCIAVMTSRCNWFASMMSTSPSSEQVPQMYKSSTLRVCHCKPWQIPVGYVTHGWRAHVHSRKGHLCIMHPFAWSVQLILSLKPFPICTSAMFDSRTGNPKCSSTVAEEASVPP